MDFIGMSGQGNLKPTCRPDLSCRGPWQPIPMQYVVSLLTAISTILSANVPAANPFVLAISAAAPIITSPWPATHAPMQAR